MVIAVAAAAALGACGGSDEPSQQPAEVVAKVDTGQGGPQGIAAGEGSVWAVANTDGSVWRIDPSNDRGSRIAVGSSPWDVAVGGGAAWVSRVADDVVVRIDTRTNTPTDDVAVPKEPTAVALAGGGVWVASDTPGSRDTLTRIDPASSRVTTSVRVDGTISDLAAAGAVLWAADLASSTLHRLNPETGAAVDAPVNVAPLPTRLAVGEGAVWASSNQAGQDTIARVDPESGRVTMVRTGVDQPFGVAAGDGAVWAGGSGRLARIDPGSNRVVGEPLAIDSANELLAAFDALWLNGGGGRFVQRLDPAPADDLEPVEDLPAPEGGPRTEIDLDASNLLTRALFTAANVCNRGGPPTASERRTLARDVDALIELAERNSDAPVPDTAAPTPPPGEASATRPIREALADVAEAVDCVPAERRKLDRAVARLG